MISIVFCKPVNKTQDLEDYFFEHLNRPSLVKDLIIKQAGGPKAICL